MKKILAVAMALVLMLGMSVQAFGETMSASKDLYVSVTGSEEIADSGERDNSVLGFTISWGEEDITVSVEKSAKQGKKWDPEQQKYVDNPETLETTYSGSNSNFDVTITNLSAVEIDVSVSFEYAEGIEYQGWIDYSIQNPKTLSAAAEGVQGGSTNLNIDFYIGNKSSEEIAELVGDNESVKIGTFTVTISKTE